MNDWKQQLRPFAEHIEEMYNLIVDATDAELEKLRDASEQPTQTNCGWSTYSAALFMAKEISSEIARRKYAKEGTHPNG